MAEQFLGLPDGEFFLLDWSPEWARLFDQERARIATALGSMVLDIQHVGSTAIPGLCAKPVIDIAIGIENFEKAFETVGPLEAIGYTFRGEFGLPRRHYFIKGSPRTHQVHMWEIASADWKRHIAFRDYLRANNIARDRYAVMKLEVSRTAKTRLEYQDAKDPLIQELQREALLQFNMK
jgi:GrpB-like predicted nucleotidyltransferase (UPF0157 family)